MAPRPPRSLGTRQISALTFNAGSAQPAGTYGSSESLATFKDDYRFAGPGTVTVGPLSTSPTVAIVLSGGSNPSAGGASLVARVNQVLADIPIELPNLGTKGFARLKVSE